MISKSFPVLLSFDNMYNIQVQAYQFDIEFRMTHEIFILLSKLNSLERERQ